MTKNQAEAILLAERVLQSVGSEGPDANDGGPWNNYVHEAASAVAGDPLLKGLCDGLHILEDTQQSAHRDLNDAFIKAASEAVQILWGKRVGHKLTPEDCAAIDETLEDFFDNRI
jgi:hypothetical protein